MLSRFFNNLYVDLNNYIERKHQRKWLSLPQSATCIICGVKVRSKTCKVCPEQLGWVKLQRTYPFERRKWICHQCSSHRNFKPYIEQIDEDLVKRYSK